MQGRVFKIFSDFYYVETDDGIIEAKLKTGLKKQKLEVFVGDIVDLEQVNRDSGQAFISFILPRKNLISRPKVANISRVIIVSAFKEPELDFEQLDRYIAHCEYHGIKPVLCFNKEDINDNDGLKDKISYVYSNCGYDIIYTSALKKCGIEELKPYLEHNTSVLCGSSGVGKSSLINALLNSSKIKTLAVSDKTGRGVHTTRHCELIPLGKDTFIADTPGFSRLKFDFILPSEISKLFAEFSAERYCKYKNCLHLDEDGCAYSDIIGAMPEERYSSYKKFVLEAKEYEKLISKKSIKKEEFSKFNQNKVMTKISSKKRVLSRKVVNQNIEIEEE